MANSNIEVELKFLLHNSINVRFWLDQHAEYVGNYVVIDTYYKPIHRDFTAMEYPYEWLRIRVIDDDGSFITYKHVHPENSPQTTHCDELETSIGDSAILSDIFAVLDFEEVVKVAKRRFIWMLSGVEISIDIIKDFGIFIELEAKEDFGNPKECRKYLFEILARLGADVGPEEFRGYPHLLMEACGYKFKTPD